MGTAIGWLLVVWDAAFGGYDLWRAIHYAASNDFPLTVFYVGMSMLMAWLGATQLRIMRQRRERNVSRS